MSAWRKEIAQVAKECDGIEGLGSDAIAIRLRAILAADSTAAPVAWMDDAGSVLSDQAKKRRIEAGTFGMNCYSEAALEAMKYTKPLYLAPPADRLAELMTELGVLAEHLKERIAVAYNEYAFGQRAGLQEAASKLRAALAACTREKQS